MAAVVFTSDNAEARHYSALSPLCAPDHHEDASDSYSPAFSSIIVDGNSGATLTANSPDGQPSSGFADQDHDALSAVRASRLRQDEARHRNAGSEHASEQAPTKLGLRPGQTIRVEDAIKGLVTRSANDAAVVIAEAIGGSDSMGRQIAPLDDHWAESARF